MRGLKVGIVLLALYGGLLFGIACTSVIIEEAWTKESAIKFVLAMMSIFYDATIVRFCIAQGLFK